MGASWNLGSLECKPLTDDEVIVSLKSCFRTQVKMAFNFNLAKKKTLAVYVPGITATL